MRKVLSYTFSFIFGAGMLFTVVNDHRPLPRLKQVRFNSWYERLAHSRVGSDEQFPPVSIALVSEKEPLKFNWSINTAATENASHNYQIKRLLDFMSAVAIFGRTEVKKEAEIVLTVAGLNQEFETKISFDELSKDIRLQNFVKLLELFSVSNLTDVKEGKEHAQS